MEGPEDVVWKVPSPAVSPASTREHGNLMAQGDVLEYDMAASHEGELQELGGELRREHERPLRVSVKPGSPTLFGREQAVKHRG